MGSLFSELRKLWDDLLAIARSPAKANSLFRNPLYSNAIYLVTSNILNAIFGFVFWIIAARIYTIEAVGTASATISAVNLLEILSWVGLNFGIIRFLKSNSNPVKLINSGFSLAGFLSLAAGAIFILGLGVWTPGLSIIRLNPLYVAFFLLYVPTEVLYDLTDAVIVARQKAKFIFIKMFVFNISRLVLLVLFLSFSRSFGIFCSWSTATFIAMLVGLFLLLPRVQPGYHPFFTVDRKAMSEVVQFSFLNYLGDLFWTVPGLIFPLIIINLLGAASSAYFYIAWAMSGILTIIPISISISLVVEGARDIKMLEIRIKQSLKMLAILLTPAVFLMWVLADKLLLFYGSQYARNASTLLRLLAIAVLPLALNMIYFSVKRIQKDMKPLILLTF